MMDDIKIGNKTIGLNYPCLICFEPSSTYENIEEAKQMIKATALSGADAVKFQTFLPGESDRMMGKKDIFVNFETSSGKKQELVYEALKRKELSKEEWKELVDYSKSLNLIFITAVYFPETIDFIADIGVDAIKISKGDVNNVLLVEKIAKKGLPIIIDGREKFEDVEYDVKICEYVGNKKIMIMHCPSGYPAKNSGVHLSALPEIQKKFQYPVGFADHSPGSIMNFAAIALGAKLLEVTITPNKNIEHVEHFMSLELDELKDFVKNIRAIEQAIGTPDILNISRVEESSRRSIIAKSDIKSGQQITRELVDFQRPGNMGISCAEGFKVLEKKALLDISKGTFLQWNMFD